MQTDANSKTTNNYLTPATVVSTSCSIGMNVSAGSSIISSNLNANTTRHQRQSSVNTVSWNETVSIQCPLPVNPPEHNNESDDIPVTLRQRSLHRRHLSMGNATYSMDEHSNLQNGCWRRHSNISWAREELNRRINSSRPNSWGPVGTAYYLESMMFDVTETTLHGECIKLILIYFKFCTKL